MVQPNAVRAAVVGLVCGLGAVLAHAGAAGHAVGTGPALLLTALGLAAGPLLARRPTSARLLAGALGVQAAGHALLALAPTSVSPAGHARIGGTGGMDGMDRAAGHGLLDGGPAMLVGHVAVAMLTTLLAVRADHAVRAVVEATLARLVPLPAPPAPRPPGRLPRPAPVVPGLAPPTATAPAGPRAPPRSRPHPATRPHLPPQPA